MREIYSSTILPQETRKTSNGQLNFSPKTTGKRRTNLPAPKVSRRKEITKIQAEINERETKETISLVQFSSVAQSCPTLCDPMICSTPGLPVHHQLLESTQIHVQLVGDAIQSSHPLMFPSPPCFNLSQHQGLFK